LRSNRKGKKEESRNRAIVSKRGREKGGPSSSGVLLKGKQEVRGEETLCLGRKKGERKGEVEYLWERRVVS